MKRIDINWELTENQLKGMLYALDLWISTFDGDSDDGEYYELLQNVMVVRELTERALYGKDITKQLNNTSRFVEGYRTRGGE